MPERERLMYLEHSKQQYVGDKNVQINQAFQLINEWLLVFYAI